MLHSSPAVSVTSGSRSGSPAAYAGCTKSMTSSGSKWPAVLPSRDFGGWQCTPLSHRTCSSKSSSRESIVSSKNRMTSFSSCVRYFRLSSSYRRGVGVGNGRKNKQWFQWRRKPGPSLEQYRAYGRMHSTLTSPTWEESATQISSLTNLCLYVPHPFTYMKKKAAKKGTEIKDLRPYD